MALSDVARTIDEQLAQHLAEAQRLAQAYEVLTGERSPVLNRVELPAAPPAALPEPAAEVDEPVDAPAVPPSRGGTRDLIEQTIRDAGPAGAQNAEIKAAAHVADAGYHVRRLLADGRVVRLGRGPGTRYVHVDVHVGDVPNDEAPPPAPPVSKRVQRELARDRAAQAVPQDPVERLFPEDGARQRIARGVLKACQTELRHPAALAAEFVFNRNETAYVMRELAREGLLVEHDGKYGRAA